MNIHIELLICCLTRAATFGELLRGVRRSRMLAQRHGVPWRLIKVAAFSSVRATRGTLGRSAA